MRAKTLNDLLKKGDKVAVSNITGREAAKVTDVSQRYGNIIVGGWALGKGGVSLELSEHPSIPVFSDFGDLINNLPEHKHPNKIVIYSPPEAVYGEVKNIISCPESKKIETIFIITEHVSVEVSAKIHYLCSQRNIDVIGCNTLGVINPHAHVRVGAVGGDQPEETFQPGSCVIISNSGNMVNTMASYLYAAGIGIRFGISTGKDRLILTPLKEFLVLAGKDPKTKLIVLYVEPGGLYEYEAIKWMKKNKFKKPIIVYVGGIMAEQNEISLGHAGAVVEGKGTSAADKIELFDEYFGIPPFRPKHTKYSNPPSRGMRIEVLHHLPLAARALYDALSLERDFRHYHLIHLNPWLKNMGELAKKLPSNLVLPEPRIPSPYKEQFESFYKTRFGKIPSHRNMRNASHASSNDGKTPRIYGYSLIKLMKEKTFAWNLILSWTGYPPSKDFEADIVDILLTASLTNGPGTISAQGAKLSASAGNSPHTAMIATLASIGTTHGGNGSDAVRFMIEIFRDSGIDTPYNRKFAKIVKKCADQVAFENARKKRAAKEADMEYGKIPCLGHPVYKNEPINYDPRERVIDEFLKKHNTYHVFLDFYHNLAAALCKYGVTRNILAVNVDAAIACIWLGICWPLLREKKITVSRAVNIPFVAFALGRSAGGAAEYLDHSDYGSDMDMRIPASECEALIRPTD